MTKRLGARTLALERKPAVRAWAAAVGEKEGAGPLGRGFDLVSDDPYFAQFPSSIAMRIYLIQRLENLIPLKINRKI